VHEFKIAKPWAVPQSYGQPQHLLGFVGQAHRRGELNVARRALKELGLNLMLQQ
jgi:hypothetical protein